MKLAIQVIGVLMFLLVFSSYVSAQGFGGKRLIANYNFGIFHASTYSDYAETGEPRSYKLLSSWNMTHHLELDYVLGRANVVGVTYLRYRTNEGKWDNSLRDMLHLYAQGYGVYYKVFQVRKGAIAPIGTWWKFQLTKLDYRAEEILNPNNSNTADVYDFRLALGKQTVMFSRFLFNISLEAAIPLPGSWESGEGFLGQNQYSKRFDFHNAINAKIGVALPIY